MGPPRSAKSPVPRAVLFDLDDTIFDHSLTSRAALGRVRADWPLLRHRSLDALWAEYARLLDVVRVYRPSGRWDAEGARRRRFERLARFCGGRVTPAVAGEISRMYRTHYQALRRPVPGARRLLERLHGQTRIAVVTNNEVAEQEEKLAYLGVDQWVDALVVSEEVGVAKPDRRIFEAALDRVAVAPEETVMVGDSWTNDVLGARAVGIGAVWFNRFRIPRPARPAVPELESFRAPRRAEEVLFREAERARAS